MEKYYPSHPEIIYATESVENPYYKTICKDYPLENWTTRIRETLKEIDDREILIMIDDLFIHNPVDTERIEQLRTLLEVDIKTGGNIACFNFEKSFDANDKPTMISGISKREHNSRYEVSIMCGLWDRDKLIDILEGEKNPWDVEETNDSKGYDFYINSGDYIIDWGYVTWKPSGLFKGKWCPNTVPFFEKEGIEMDYSKRGFAKF
jgi:hypothetical protein